MIKTLLLLLCAGMLFPASVELRTVDIETIKVLWNPKLLPDEKSFEVNVPIESDEIIWLNDIETIEKGWSARLVVHWEDLIIANPLLPDIQYDYLDKEQKTLYLKFVCKSDGRGVIVGPNANIGVSSGPLGVCLVGGKATGITGVIRCKVILRRNYDTLQKYKKEQENK